jgi:diketogulonate reductase-like aldo/keto reductase
MVVRVIESVPILIKLAGPEASVRKTEKMNRRKFLTSSGALAATFSIPGSGWVLATEDRKIATRPIPSSGEALPIVGFGNSSSFREGDYENSQKLLDVLLEHGGRYIDTWASNQQIFGRYMREHDAKGRFFLGTNAGARDPEDMMTAVQRAKTSQETDVLDLLQVPNPSDFDTQWRLIRQAKDDGHARHIGIAIARTRYYDLVESLIKSGTSDFVQVNYSMLEPQTGERLLPLARDHGVAVLVNRPFLNGQYFSLVRDKELPHWAAEFDCHSWAQFALKWIISNPAVNCALTETSKTEHAIDNLSAGVGGLPDEKTRTRMQELLQSFLATSKESIELRRG